MGVNMVRMTEPECFKFTHTYLVHVLERIDDGV